MGLLVLMSLPMTRNIDAKQVTGRSNAQLPTFIFPLIGLFVTPIYSVINSLILSALPKHMHSTMINLIVIFSALGDTNGSLITGLVFACFSGLTAI